MNLIYRWQKTALAWSGRRQAIAPVVAVLGWLAVISSAQATVHLKIAANTQVIESFKNWTATTPWDQIKKFDSPYANRPTVDFVLELQALKAGGLDFDFEFAAVPNYERGRLEVANGDADLGAETVWESDMDETSFLRSKPVINDGEFVKGIYVLPDNVRALKISTLEELRALDLVMVANWDLKLVEAIQPKTYNKTTQIENVALMLQKGRGDYTLLEFSSSPDMSQEIAGVKLVPVPNCKVVLAGNRFWVVSKKSPEAADISAALDKGLQSLRDEGVVGRAFTESGFFSPKVADWKRLNP